MPCSARRSPRRVLDMPGRRGCGRERTAIRRRTPAASGSATSSGGSRRSYPIVHSVGMGVTHRTVLVAFSGIMLATLLAALDQTIVATALPSIVTDLGGFDHLSWVVTAYLLTSTVTVPLYGKLSD